MCFKANLFYSKNDFNNKFDLINNECKKGSFIKYEDFIESDSFKNYKYYMPHRYDWVSTFNIVDFWLNYDEVIKMVNTYYNLKKSPLLWLKDSSTSSWLFITFN